MTTATEPVIVTGTAGPVPVALADVLIVAGRRWTVAACADLFTRYPGLTLVVGRDPGGTVCAGARDGGWLGLRLEPPWPPLPRLARTLYRWWVAGGGPTRPGVPTGDGSAVLVEVGSWRGCR
jgi:hypothetical protein